MKYNLLRFKLKSLGYIASLLHKRCDDNITSESFLRKANYLPLSLSQFRDSVCNMRIIGSIVCSFRFESYDSNL